MQLLNTLEKRLGHFAIPGLVRYVIALNAFVFLLGMMDPQYVGMLEFDRAAILSGQVWRIVSWIFIPTTTSLLWIFCYLSFTWWVGDSLEATWGTFRLNIYCLLGFLGCIAGGWLFGVNGGNYMLSLTLLLAAATLAPNLQILLFYIIPMKLKWVAAIGMIFPVYLFVFGGLAGQAIVVLCLANYLVFFGPDLFRQAAMNRATSVRRAKFAASSISPDTTLHRCAGCGRTEVSNPELDFRVSADGNEYCTAHLPAKNPAP